MRCWNGAITSRTYYQLAFALHLLVLVACKSTKAPIYVWQSPSGQLTSGQTIALMPTIAPNMLGTAFDEALTQNLPTRAANIAVLTPAQLAEASPVRLASTAEMKSDILAMKAAKQLNAALLVQGQIVRSNIQLEGVNPLPIANKNMNQVFFERLANFGKRSDDRMILMNWRIIDVENGRTVATESLNLNSTLAAKTHPDLASQHVSADSLILAAAARESWSKFVPHVQREEVRLAKSLLMPGSIRVYLGNRAAKKGEWNVAEKQWKRVADSWIPNAAAEHNLAIAYAAREDFEQAKQQLQKANGLMRFRLPEESFFWLDQHQRTYYQIHGIPEPPRFWDEAL